MRPPQAIRRSRKLVLDWEIPAVRALELGHGLAPSVPAGLVSRLGDKLVMLEGMSLRAEGV